MNDLVKLVRQQFPDDPRSDQRLTYELGRLAESSRPDLLEQFPEFATQYKDIKRALRPGLWEEFKGSVGSAADNLQATTIGAGALAADAVGANRLAAYLAEQAAEQERQAAEFQPSVGSYKDVESLADAAYYMVYGAGQIVPSAAESAVMAGAGAAAGTLAEPGGGTIAGGLAGLVAKTASRNLIRAGIKDLTSELGKAALRKETKAVASQMLARAGLAASTIPQSAGEIYNETGDVGISASMGTLAGALDLLPESYVLSKFFKPGVKIADKEASKVLGYVKRLGVEASKTMPMEGSTEAAQEFINWAAGKWSRGEPASITEADIERFTNAGLIGAIGGGIFAPVAAMGGGREIQAGQPEAPAVTPSAPARRTATGLDEARALAGIGEQVDTKGVSTPFDDALNVGRGENRVAAAVASVKAAREAAAQAEQEAQERALFERGMAAESERVARLQEEQALRERAAAMMGNIPESANLAPAIEARANAEREATRRLGMAMVGAPEPTEFDLMQQALAPAPQATPTPISVAAAPSVQTVTAPSMEAAPAPVVVPEPAQLPTAPVVTAPADLNGLSFIRDLRNQPMTPDERAASVKELAGKNKKNSAGAAVILDRATGRVHIKPVYQNKEVMVDWMQARTKSTGKQGPGRTIDPDAATEGTAMRNVLAATLEDGSPRFEVIGSTAYRTPEVAQPLTFASLEEYAGSPDVDGLIKAGFEHNQISERTRDRRPKSKGKVALEPVGEIVSNDARAALSTDEGAVGSRERSMESVGIVDEDAEAQGRGVQPTATEEPVVESPTETPEVGSRKAVLAIAMAIRQGASESDLEGLARAELAKHGINEKTIADISHKTTRKTMTLKQLTSYIVAAAEDVAAQLENLTRRAAAGFRMPESQRIALFQNMVDAIRASGGEVVAFEQKLMEGVAAWQQASGFQLTQADGRSLVGLALNALDVRDPDALVVLSHETAHHFLEKALPDPSMRLKFQSALARLPWGKQRWLMNPLSTDMRLIANADPATLSDYQKALLDALPPQELEKLRRTDPSTLLVEQGAEHLAMLGLDKGVSRSLLAQVIRAMKDLLVRTAMAVQRTLKGDGAVSDRLVRQFVENRWLQFINRDFASSRNAISNLRNWIGAPATYRERTADYAKLSGDPRVGEVDLESGLWNPVEFVPETAEQLADKLQAVTVNQTIRPSIKQTIRYTPEEQVNSEFAAINYVDESIGSIWNHLKQVMPRAINEAADPVAKFMADYLGVRAASAPGTLRSALIQRASQEVDPLSAQPIRFNPATQINQLAVTRENVTDAEGRLRQVSTASAQQYAMRAALSRLYSIRNGVQNRIAKKRDRFERLSRRKQLSEKEMAERTQLSQDIALLERMINEPDAGLRWRIGELERRRGVTVPDIFYPGAEYRVPAGVDADPSAFKSRNLPKDLRFNQRQKEEFISGLASMRKWLDNEENLKHGLEYNRMLQQWKRLSEHFSTEYVYSAVTFNLRRTFTTGLVDMFRKIGTPNATHAGKMVNLYSAAIAKHHENARILGPQWAESYQALAKAMGRRMDESFREDVWSTLNKVFEQISEGTPNAVELGRQILERHYEMNLTGKAREAFADLVRETRRVQMWRREVFNDLGLKVEDDNLGNRLQRDLGDIGYFNGQRTISRSLESLYLQMRPLWTSTDGDVHPIMRMPEAQLGQYFTDQVIQDFVEPLIRSNSEFINFREPTDGGRFVNVGTARQDLVREAWASANGSVLEFARTLHRLSERDADVQQTVNDVLASFLGVYDQVKKQVERRLTAETGGNETMQRQMMDSRAADNWPPEWVSYAEYNATSNYVFLKQAAMNYAFGRNGFSADGEFMHLVSAIRSDLRELRDRSLSLRDSGLDEKEIKRRMGADEYQIALQARDHLDMLDGMEKKLPLLNSTTGYQLADMRLVTDAIHLQSSLVLQQPRTALINMTDILAPFYKTKFSTVSVNAVARALKSLGSQFSNSLAEAVGMDLALNSDMEIRRHGANIKDPDNYATFKQKIADAKTRFAPGNQPESALEKAGRVAAIGIRVARETINVGRNEVLPNTAPKALAPKFRPFGIFSATSRMITNALVDAFYHSVNDLAIRAVEHIERSGGEKFAQELESGRVRLSPDSLGYTRKWMLLNDRAAYDYLADSLVTKMAERSVEDFAVKAWRRMKAAQGGKWEAVDNDQFVRIANVATNEFSIQANEATAPIGMMASPGGRLLSVFLMWPWMAMLRSANAFRDPRGKITMESALDGVTLMMMGAIPATLAASLLVDLYDEKVVGKRSNLRDLSIEDPMSIMERLARYGTFGILSEAVNGAINFDDARGGFSADNRIFIFSQFNAIRNLVGNLYQQEGEATYQSVGRPLLQFMGMNGVLQYTQIVNHAAGLKNIEAAVNERINSGNYLRATGRALDLDVRIMRGAQSIPTPVTPYIQQMELAATTDNTTLFREAYAKAVQMAAREGKEDPAAYVREAVASRHPLRRIFRTLPSEAEYRGILNHLNDTGRDAVSRAVTSYNRYLQLLGMKPVVGKKEKAGSVLAAPKPAMSLDQARALAAQAAWGGGLY